MKVLYGGISGLTGNNSAATLINGTDALYLPLPFFFSRDSGVSLPTAALPYNEIKIEFTFRNSGDLLYSHYQQKLHLTVSAVPGTVTAGTVAAQYTWCSIIKMFKFGLTTL